MAPGGHPGRERRVTRALAGVHVPDVGKFVHQADELIHVYQMSPDVTVSGGGRRRLIRPLRPRPVLAANMLDSIGCHLT
jgi:hypothetical protein